MIPLIIIAASLVTHLLFFGHPAQVVFDEVHNGFFISQYWQGTFYFDVHPPLGKLILALFGFLADIPQVVNFSSIGNALPEAWLLMRLIPTLAGVILPVIIYAICRRLDLSKFGSLIAALLVVLENSLLVQSRVIMFDSLILLFGFLGILCFLEFRTDKKDWSRKARKYFLILSILFASAAFGIKWTGLSFALIIILLDYFMLSVKGTGRKLLFQKVSKLTALFVVIGGLFYFLVFALHFALLPSTGSGNDYMTAEFQKSLESNKFMSDEGVHPLGLFGKFGEINYQMYKYTSNLNDPHDYSSEWYTWPLMTRPIFYWENMGNYIYYFGNPLIYWTGAVSVVALFFYCVHTFVAWLRKRDVKHSVPALFILAGFAANFIPFIFIGRTMFLYHYAPALVFTIMAIAFWIDKVRDERRKILIGTLVLVASFALFLFFSPLTYGLSLTDAELYSKMWFGTWR